LNTRDSNSYEATSSVSRAGTTTTLVE